MATVSPHSVSATDMPGFQTWQFDLRNAQRKAYGAFLLAWLFTYPPCMIVFPFSQYLSVVLVPYLWYRAWSKFRELDALCNQDICPSLWKKNNTLLIFAIILALDLGIRAFLPFLSPMTGVATILFLIGVVEFAVSFYTSSAILRPYCHLPYTGNSLTLFRIYEWCFLISFVTLIGIAAASFALKDNGFLVEHSVRGYAEYRLQIDTATTGWPEFILIPFGIIAGLSYLITLYSPLYLAYRCGNDAALELSVVQRQEREQAGRNQNTSIDAIS